MEQLVVMIPYFIGTNDEYDYCNLWGAIGIICISFQLLFVSNSLGVETLLVANSIMLAKADYCFLIGELRLRCYCSHCFRAGKT